MFPPGANVDQFLEQTKAARMERARERRREEATLCIQRHFRGYKCRKKFRESVYAHFDNLFKKYEGTNPTIKLPAMEMYLAIKKFMFVMNPERERQRFERMASYLIANLESEQQESYLRVALNKKYAINWIQQLKEVLSRSSTYLGQLKIENNPQELKSLMVHLHLLVTFTSPNTWALLKNKQYENAKPAMVQLANSLQSHLVSRGLFGSLQTVLTKGLLRVRPLLKKTALMAISNLALRPLISSHFSGTVMNEFLLHILSVPALLHFLDTLAPEALQLFLTHKIFQHFLEVLVDEQNTRILFNVLEGNYTLCLFANLVQLAQANLHIFETHLLPFITVGTRLLEKCQQYVVRKKSILTHWHPILGWFAQTINHEFHESMVHVKKQLQSLWTEPLLGVMFMGLDGITPSVPSPPATETSNGPGIKVFFRRVFSDHSSHVQRSTSIAVQNFRKLGSSDTMQISLTCYFYQTLLSTLTQMKVDVLTGISYHEELLAKLWAFISLLGPGGPLKAFLDHVALTSKPCSPECHILILFADCASHLITILDDLEFYEKQKPFSLEDLTAISYFLNQLVFKLIWNNYIDVKTASNNPLLSSLHALLMLLYKRDCRRSYTPPDHWLIKEIKVASFMADLEKGKKTALLLMQMVPHIIPHKERVVLFRKSVNDEKAVLGLTESACASPQSTLVTIHRSRLVEDGYHQLALLPAPALKGVIRIRFINEQGLDEAGIDQDGVFKEFLEETVQRIFDPGLNLFKVTNEHRLYPSPSSFIQENHLSLFEFVGKMLGKAVYEGIVIDIPFASFFLSQVLGHQHSALYSSIDELPSLDYDLYKSLTYIKHYQGDVQELGLTFSVDDECMGQIVTHELVPGGRAISVTNENRISYIHLMAHFRMHVQICEQAEAFIRGFHALINPEWLTIFSTPELQRLISGDNTPIDLQDLRRHTKYFGGFHNNHRVINWLWDILEKDFTPEEHRLFLKFVTSCSKPPLLGFAHLEPPFSIRCVEVGEEQDTGDTVGSVLRGFFTIHRGRGSDPVNRLPTSSTCFNLLKLPNYQRKATLRDKLRYAITSNTGFELS